MAASTPTRQAQRASQNPQASSFPGPPRGVCRLCRSLLGPLHSGQARRHAQAQSHAASMAAPSQLWAPPRPSRPGRSLESGEGLAGPPHRTSSTTGVQHSSGKRHRNHSLHSAYAERRGSPQDALTCVLDPRRPRQRGRRLPWPSSQEACRQLGAAPRATSWAGVEHSPGWPGTRGDPQPSSTRKS